MTSRIVMTCLATLGLTAGSFAQDEAERKPLFGELHIHTGWSFDAYVFGARATPDDAYEFAKGKPLKHPLGKTYQISRPLDFMGVTDHAMYMGAFATMRDDSHSAFQASPRGSGKRSGSRCGAYGIQGHRCWGRTCGRFGAAARSSVTKRYLGKDYRIRESP